MILSCLRAICSCIPQACLSLASCVLCAASHSIPHSLKYHSQNLRYPCPAFSRSAGQGYRRLWERGGGRLNSRLVKPGSHIPQTYLRRSCRLQLTTFGNLSQRAPGASAMDRRRTQFCSKYKSNCAIFNHFTSKYGSNRLTGVRCDRR